MYINFRLLSLLVFFLFVLYIVDQPDRDPCVITAPNINNPTPIAPNDAAHTATGCASFTKHRSPARKHIAPLRTIAGAATLVVKAKLARSRDLANSSVVSL
jgi:hypothetical protein